MSGEEEEDEDDDMACDHIGEETDSEGERFTDKADDFDEEHEGPEGFGDTVGYKVNPIEDGALFFHTVSLSDEECDECEGESDGEVTGDGCGQGDEAEEVRESDEKEECGEEREPGFGFLVEVGF